MSLSHLYDDFGRSGGAFTGGLMIPDDADEEARLEGFENGYKAGWEDAIKAHEKDSERVAADLAQSLQDMSFTYAEVQSKLLGGLSPIISQITHALLPRIAIETFGAQISAEILSLVKDAAPGAVELTISPDASAVLRAQLNEKIPLPFTLAEDAELAPGIAFVRAGNQEREINIDAVLKGVTDAMTAFLDQSLKEPING